MMTKKRKKKMKKTKEKMPIKATKIIRVLKTPKENNLNKI